MNEISSQTECTGDGCFASEWCKRYSTSPGADRFIESPINKMSGSCEYFIPISDEYEGAVPH